MTPEMAEAFSVMVSDTIRTYIEKRFQHAGHPENHP